MATEQVNYELRRLSGGQELPVVRTWLQGGVEQSEPSGGTLVWPSSSPPESPYPPYPAMPAGWVLQPQQIDTSVNQGWQQTNGVRTTDSAVNRAANTRFGVGPDGDAMCITVTKTGSTYYSSDAQARFCPMPGEFVLENYFMLEAPAGLGSGCFPAQWFRPSGNMYGGGYADGEYDLFEWKGKFYNMSPTHTGRWVHNLITTHNGSYSSSVNRVNNMGAAVDAAGFNLENTWHHIRYVVTATSATVFMNGVQVGQITRANASPITLAEFDRCFGNSHDWYFRVTYQWGIGTGADAGGPANDALLGASDPAATTEPGLRLWTRDVRIY